MSVVYSLGFEDCSELGNRQNATRYVHLNLKSNQTNRLISFLENMKTHKEQKTSYRIIQKLCKTYMCCLQLLLYLSGRAKKEAFSSKTCFLKSFFGRSKNVTKNIIQPSIKLPIIIPSQNNTLPCYFNENAFLVTAVLSRSKNVLIYTLRYCGSNKTWFF